MEKGWLLLSRRETLNFFNPFKLRGALALANTGALIYGIRPGGFSWIWGREMPSNSQQQDVEGSASGANDNGSSAEVVVAQVDDHPESTSTEQCAPTPATKTRRWNIGCRLRKALRAFSCCSAASREVDDSNVGSEQPRTSLRPARRTSNWYDLTKRGCMTEPIITYAVATGVYERELEAQQRYRPHVEYRVMVLDDPEYYEFVRLFDENTILGNYYHVRGSVAVDARTVIFLDEEPESSVMEEAPSTSQQQDVEGSASGAKESGSSAGVVVPVNGHSPTPATNSRRWKIGSRLRKALRAFSCCSASRDSNSEPEPAVQDEPNQNQGSRTPRRSGGFLRRLFHKRR
ncbi:uncharacterized protein [Hoplias malabaricus]|uniref:uncharacterized protein n=1 Tax=Hoplias malabaricus TaxID=27720 RepID=UPI003462409B